ncbi:hypothetical protein BDW66DRAFT_73881 [Aspergillus desertorum]
MLGAHPCILRTTIPLKSSVQLSKMSSLDSLAAKGNSGADTAKLKVLDDVSKLEPSRGRSHAHRWKLTGPPQALMLETANYPIDKQPRHSSSTINGL